MTDRLDPTPWRIVFGPWRNTRIDTRIPDSDFNPRPEYEQDRGKYAE